MALNNLGLGFLFTAKDMASGTMRRVQGNFNQFAGGSVKQMGTMQGAIAATGLGLATMAAGIGAVAGSFALANEFAKFEQGLAAVGAVTKASTREMQLLKDAAVQAGIATQFSPDEATEGLLSLATAGQTAKQATKTLIPVLDLAAGSLGQLGVAESAESVVGTLNAYGMAANEAANVTDRLLRITQLTNFQTRDFQVGLAKAAAAGATFNQDLNDVLITMGLLRNRNIDASSSATALRESVRRLGSDQNAQKAMAEAGVEVFDEQTGKMRSLIDITSDLAEVTSTMTDEERNRIIVQGFGARGLLAFNAIQKAAFTTMKDGTEITLEGREAIAALRAEMEETGGTAASFRDKLLDTFEGQKTLLKGSMQTLGIVAGEGFAVTFKPIISLVIEGVNVFIRLIKATPTPLKQFIAAIVIAGGALTAGAGAATLIGVAIALLIPVIKVVLITLAAIAVIMAPVIVAILGVVGALILLKSAFDQNVGGIADSAASWWTKIKLTFQAASQLFSQGGFSGAVREEMQKAENQGIRNFAVGLFMWVERIKNFFSGLVEGFRARIQEAAPLFESLKEAVGELGHAFNQLFGEADADEASQTWREFGSTGESVGRTVARAIDGIVLGITVLVRWWTVLLTAARYFGDIWAKDVQPALDEAKESFNDLKSSMDGFKSNARGTGEEMSGLVRMVTMAFRIMLIPIRVGIMLWSIFARTTAAALTFAQQAVASFAAIVSGIFGFVRAMISGDWNAMWAEAGMVVFGVLNSVIQMLIAFARTFAGVIDSIAASAGQDLGATEKVNALAGRMEGGLAKMTGVEVRDGRPVFVDESDITKPADPATRAAEEQANTARVLEEIGDAFPKKEEAGSDQRSTAELISEMQSLTSGMDKLGARPIQNNLTLTIDGQELAAALEGGSGRNDARGFAPGQGSTD